jgi:flagellar hook-basal body complex protein FliE
MITGIQSTSIAGAASSNPLPSMTHSLGKAAGSSGKSPFSDLLDDAVGKVSHLEEQARVAVDGLMTGSGVDVHQAMIASEKANMAFEMALALRNKAVQSYQSVMGMQF